MGESPSTARGIRDAILSGATSAEAVCEATLSRIASVDAHLHAFHLVAADRARAQARALDASATPRGPLHGVPIALKDNITVASLTATAGSRMLADYVAPYDATVVQKLEAAGAVIIGKTSCD